MKNATAYLFLFATMFIASCKPSIAPEDLYGKWKYTKLENLKTYPPSTMPDWKLKIQSPTIEFTKSNDLIMVWAGEVLAHGKFRIDGDKIQFNQVLEGGQTREFPFYVIELKDKTIQLETKGEEATRVTAVKQ